MSKKKKARKKPARVAKQDSGFEKLLAQAIIEAKQLDLFLLVEPPPTTNESWRVYDKKTGDLLMTYRPHNKTWTLHLNRRGQHRGDSPNVFAALRIARQQADASFA